MKKYLLLIMVLCFVFIGIQAEITDVEIAKSGNVIQSNLSFDNSTVVPGSGNIAPNYDNPTYVEGNRWSDDILVMSNGIPTLGVLSTDVDETSGDIYVSLLDPNSGQNDTVYTYRSQDGGRTWSPFWT
ncbi:MAG: hypothetical protein GWP03_05250 [Proteobacteria bacterium]|nr:hypothetical protein [Pseudomonadota bacterium]